MSTLGLDQLATLLCEGRRVLLLIRHSERYSIPDNAEDLGVSVPLTPRGEQMARELGVTLAQRLTGPVSMQLFSSPVERCQRTALRIAEGMGVEHPSVEIMPEIGVEGVYVGDPKEWADVLHGDHTGKALFDYMQNGVARGFSPLGPASERLMQTMKQCSAQFGLFVSHDVMIMPFLSTWRIANAQEWLGFMEGALIVLDPLGDTHSVHAFAPFTSIN